MNTMKIFEPAMCCSTGLCGVSLDPELLRVSTVLNTLKRHGVKVLRFNLTSAPAEFVKNNVVRDYLQRSGPDKLPVVLVNDSMVIAGRYPTNEEFTSWLELSPGILEASCCENDAPSCCGGPAPAERGTRNNGPAPAECDTRNSCPAPAERGTRNGKPGPQKTRH